MNTRFALATHIITFIETCDGALASSELIASSVGTNPSLVRRMLQTLSRKGLTVSQLGSGGGATLARPAHEITMLDIYRAVKGDDDIFPVHGNPNPKCLVGRNIEDALTTYTEAAEEALERKLAGVTVSMLLHTIRRVENIRRHTSPAMAAE